MFGRPRRGYSGSRAAELAAEMERVSTLRVVPAHPPRARARRFDAANIDRLTASWLASGAAIDQELRGQLDLLRARSRDLHQNSEYVKGFARLVRNNVVGPEGFTLQVRVVDPNGKPDAAANSAIEAAFLRWCRKENCDVTGRRTFVTMVRGLVNSASRDGEFLVRKVRGRGRGAYGYQLQPLDVARLDTQLNREAVGDENAIVMGVEMDAYRKPVAYHIWTSAAGAGRISRERERVPAHEIIHGFIPLEDEQTRGCPWAHASMRSLNDLKGYREAAVVAARVGASKMGFYVAPDGNVPNAEQNAEGEFVQDATPATFEVLPIGYDFKEFNPTYPHEQFDSFNKAILRGVSTGLGVSYHQLANDLEGVSFSSIRSGTLSERDEWMALQNWVIGALLTEVYEDWIESALMMNAIRLPSGTALPASKLEKFREHMWQGRRWAWVDPLKDIQASVMAMDNLLASPQQIAAQAGRDIEDVLDDIAAFMALCAEKKVAAKARAPKPETEPETAPATADDE